MEFMDSFDLDDNDDEPLLGIETKIPGGIHDFQAKIAEFAVVP